MLNGVMVPQKNPGSDSFRPVHARRVLTGQLTMVYCNKSEKLGVGSVVIC